MKSVEHIIHCLSVTPSVSILSIQMFLKRSCWILLFEWSELLVWPAWFLIGRNNINFFRAVASPFAPKLVHAKCKVFFLIKLLINYIYIIIVIQFIHMINENVLVILNSCIFFELNWWQKESMNIHWYF